MNRSVPIKNRHTNESEARALETNFVFEHRTLSRKAAEDFTFERVKTDREETEANSLCAR